LLVSALASCTMEDFDRSRLRRLSSVRMQVVAFLVQSCHSYLPPFSIFVQFFLMCSLLQFYCQHMRSKALGLLAPALPANLPITESPAMCACGLPLQHSDLESISPCEALAIRMSNQIDSSSGMVQASSYTAADKQHWEDINKELPPAPGDKKNTGQQRETPLTSPYLNIGELHRWVLLRGENLLDRSEPLQHDILWHWSPHKICSAKNSSGSTGTTPRSKNSTPTNTPLAGGNAAKEKLSFGSFGAPSNSSGGGGAAASFGGTTTSHKRNLNQSFSSPIQDLYLTSLPTVQRKKQTLRAPHAGIERATAAASQVPQ